MRAKRVLINNGYVFPKEMGFYNVDLYVAPNGGEPPPFSPDVVTNGRNNGCAVAFITHQDDLYDLPSDPFLIIYGISKRTISTKGLAELNDPNRSVVILGSLTGSTKLKLGEYTEIGFEEDEDGIKTSWTLFHVDEDVDVEDVEDVDEVVDEDITNTEE